MKKITIFLSFVLLSSIGFTQDGNSDVITVKKADLPADMVAKLEQQNKLQEIKQNLDTMKQMASTGKEIGIAINDGLKAVTDQTVRFSATPVGRFTMFLIAWKVMAEDVKELSSVLLGVLFGVPFLIFLDFFLLWIYRRTTSKRRILVSDGPDKEGKKYEYIDTWYTKESTDSDVNSNKLAFIICWWIVFAVGNIWIVAGVIF